MAEFMGGRLIWSGGGQPTEESMAAEKDNKLHS